MRGPGSFYVQHVPISVCREKYSRVAVTTPLQVWVDLTGLQSKFQTLWNVPSLPGPIPAWPMHQPGLCRLAVALDSMNEGQL